MCNTWSMLYENLNEYVQYLQSFPRSRPKQVLSLARMEAMLTELGHPEQGLKGIQVGGTNGKGSTVTIAERVLREAGYITGSYFSPHLVTYTERIQVNGQPIPKNDFVTTIDYVRPIVDRVERKIHDRLTWFELLSIVAILYFKNRKVDVVVWEVGIGGQFDPGNLLDLSAKVITNVQRDHLSILGPTLDDVAHEKAGLIRTKHDTVITSVEEPFVQHMLDRAAEVGAKIIRVNEENDVLIHDVSFEGTKFCAFGTRELTTPLIGSHFALNVCLAITAARQFDSAITDEVERRAVAQAFIPGRFQVVSQRPTTVLDIAHNVDAIERLVETVDDLGIPRNELAVVFAAKRRKQVTEMLKVLSTHAGYFVFPHEKGFHDATFLSHLVERADVAPSIPRALRLARANVGNNGVILITGSSFFVGDVFAYIEGIERNSLDRIDDNLVEQLNRPLQIDRSML